MLNTTQTNAFWESAYLTYKLHRGQVKVEEKYIESSGVSKLFVLDCARQFGKSRWGAKTSAETSLGIDNARSVYATAYFKDLRSFILPAFDFIFEDCPKELAPEYKGQTNEFEFKNGSTIGLIGLDRNPNGPRGNKLDLAILDECGFMSRVRYLYESVLIPATTHVPHARIIMMSTQPETPDHEFVGFCDQAEEQDCYIKLDVYENPLLSPVQIDEIAMELAPKLPGLSREQKIALGKATTAFRREYLCERVVEEGRALVPEFVESLHVVESPKNLAHKFWRRLEALDSGVRDQTACLFGYYDFARAKLVIEDEFAITGKDVTTRRIAELVRSTEDKLEHYANAYRIADNDNLILLQDLGSEFDCLFSPTSKDDLAAMVNKLRLWFQSNRIEIHPRCKRLIACLKAGIWNKLRTEFDRSHTHGHYDLIAALVYMVRNVPEQDNPVPGFWNADLSNVIYPTIQDSNGINELRRGFIRR